MIIRPSGQPQSGKEDNPSDSNSRNNILSLSWLKLTLYGVLTIGLIVVGISFLDKKPLLAPPIPSALESFEPQLRAYIAEKILWLQEEPHDATRYATLGMVYAVNSLWPEARLAFQNSAILDPNEPLAFLYAAIATQELGEQDAALDLYREISDRFPQFPQGHYRLGDALLKTGSDEEAEIAFQKLVSLAPNEWRGYSGLGEIELRRGQLVEAVELFQKALRLDPEALIAHHLLGLAYRGLERTQDAERELRLGQNAVVYPMPDSWAMAANQHVKLLQDQFDMANDFTKAGRPSTAIEILESARSFYPNHVSLLNNLAVAYLRAGQPAKTRELAERVTQLDPNNLSSCVNLTGSFIAMEKMDEALIHANRAIELSPQTPHGYLAKANVMLKLENDDEALEALKMALQYDPENAQLQLETGDVCLRNLDRPMEALGYYAQAVKLNPLWPAARANLADAHLRLGNTNEAREAIGEIEKLNPNDPSISILKNRLMLPVPP